MLWIGRRIMMQLKVRKLKIINLLKFSLFVWQFPKILQLNFSLGVIQSNVCNLMKIKL
jgi:hypothetical protein